MRSYVGDRLVDLAGQATVGSLARTATVLVARFLCAGQIEPRKAAQGLRDLAHDIRLCGDVVGMGCEAQAFSSPDLVLLDDAARLIEAERATEAA